MFLPCPDFPAGDLRESREDPEIPDSENSGRNPREFHDYFVDFYIQNSECVAERSPKKDNIIEEVHMAGKKVRQQWRAAAPATYSPAQPRPESLLAMSKPAALDLLEMRGQEGTSSELRLETPPELQRETPQHAGRTEPAPGSSPWSPIPLILGIMLLCLLLLITVRIYGAQVMELSQEKENRIQCPASCPEPNTRVPGRPQDQPPDNEEKCPGRWSHSESRSYLFSPEKRPWGQCKSSCSSHSASLLMIDSQEELDFINTESFLYSEYRGSALYYYPFWTGLSYNSETKKWVWADGTALSPGLIQLPDHSRGNYAGGGCVYVQGVAFKMGRCEETQFCICEKIKAAG
ncbi:C-type lectin domain family 7 member A-like [Alligator sinensis]|uniref:C-type lectin domain family 7 member A-like n=1 Tax=Alligator sinensis TaxID=38654 RepID=A0A3Q0HBT2_ALLSI|nr:C-type lectin domain family 7 member A-like [Alligator sinensis]